MYYQTYFILELGLPVTVMQVIDDHSLENRVNVFVDFLAHSSSRDFSIRFPNPSIVVEQEDLERLRNLLDQNYAQADPNLKRKMVTLNIVAGLRFIPNQYSDLFDRIKEILDTAPPHDEVYWKGLMNTPFYNTITKGMTMAQNATLQQRLMEYMSEHTMWYDGYGLIEIPPLPGSFRWSSIKKFHKRMRKCLAGYAHGVLLDIISVIPDGEILRWSRMGDARLGRMILNFQKFRIRDVDSLIGDLRSGKELCCDEPLFGD